MKRAPSGWRRNGYRDRTWRRGRLLTDLVRYARLEKTPIKYVDSGGMATKVMENFLNHFDIQGERIPASDYDAYEAVIAGRADLMMSTILHAADLTNTGRVRAVAVTGASRNARLPDVPAVAEFFPEYSDGDWQRPMPAAHIATTARQAPIGWIPKLRMQCRRSILPRLLSLLLPRNSAPK